MAGKSKTTRRRKGERRETGTAGESSDRATGRTRTLPPDPQAMGRSLTPDERVDEASLESMDGSDPPAHSSARSGGPRRPDDLESQGPSEDAIRRRAYELWEADGRPEGRDENYWYRAQKDLSGGGRGSSS